MKAYKLVKKNKDGSYHPLYVNTNTEFKIGEVYKATEEAEDFIHGVRKVKSKLGLLSWRPGVHCCEFPLADHIGVKQPDGTLAQRKDNVWMEVEINLPNITELARENGRNRFGKVIDKRACFKELHHGFYWYQTTPLAKVRWLIASKVKIIREISNDEVASICKENGLKPQKLES